MGRAVVCGGGVRGVWEIINEQLVEWRVKPLVLFCSSIISPCSPRYRQRLQEETASGRFFEEWKSGGWGADFLRYSHYVNSCQNLQNFYAVSVQ